MNRKISVVIPTFNREKLLKIAINSVVRQTFKPYEIILVTGNKNNNLKNIIKNLNLKKNINLKYYYNKNGSVATNRNFGVKKSKASKIAFLDDDDKWHKNYLSSALKIFTKKQDAAAVICWMKVISKNKIKKFKSIIEKISLQELYVKNPGIVGSNLVIKKTIFKRLKGFDKTVEPSEDKDFLIRFLKNKFSYAVLKKRYVLHRRHSNNLSHNLFKQLKGSLNFYKKYKKDMNNESKITFLNKVFILRYKSTQSFLSKIYYIFIILNLKIYFLIKNFFKI